VRVQRSTPIALAFVLSLAACDSMLLLSPSAPQGIDGIVLAGPQCPVETVDNPCPDQPIQAKLTVASMDGDVVTELETELDGRFRVGLEPGGYVLIPRSGTPFPIAAAQEVKVERGVFTTVTVHFDTGIR